MPVHYGECTATHSYSSGPCGHHHAMEGDNLRLVGNQHSLLYQINLKYAYKTDELKNSDKSSREKMNIFKVNDKARDEELKNVMTADQFKTYQAKKAETIKKFRQEMKTK